MKQVAKLKNMKQVLSTKRPMCHDVTISLDEAASLLDVSQRTIRRWVHKGMPHDVKGLRGYRFVLEDIKKWLRAQTQKNKRS